MVKKNTRILLVEDDEDDYILTKDLLDEFMDASYRLDWVKDYEHAKQQLLADEHDLCLMDYKLGAYDGIQLLKEVIVHDVSFPIIMLTGVNDSSLDNIALKAGAADYLIKSDLSVETIARAVRYALARRDTERERVERLRAESASRAKTEFLTRLSHELRTPLTAILGYTDLLYTHSEKSDDREYLQIVSQNGKHLLALLNDVLDLSKIEAGKLEIEQGYFDIEPFFSDIYQLFSMKAKDKGLAFDVRFLGDLLPVFYGDATRLRQIVLNLVGNAIKFTAQGSVMVDVSRTIDHSNNPDTPQAQLKICVMDTGSGIPEEKVQDIFLPFNQAGGNNHPVERGTGLGLTISRELVSRMGGELTVDSELGKGSCFCCTLPWEFSDDRPPQRLEISAHNKQHASQTAPTYSGQVLVVDDLSDIRSLVGHMVANTGVHIHYAENGKEALDFIHASQAQHKTIDLILMDLQMPVMGGMDAARAMRQLGFTGPIVALTASSMKGDREKCMEAGFSDFLGKPIERTRLEKIMNKWLPRSQPEAANSAMPMQEAAAPHQGQGRILVIEDDPDACKLTALLLGQEGWQSAEAHSGMEALKQLASNDFDAVLFDIHLPDTDGYQLAKAIKQKSDDIQLIALSGEEIDHTRFDNIEILHTILKPVNRQLLANALNKLSPR